MTQRNITITQDMLTAAGECIETAVTQDDMQGIVFLQVSGGLWTIYNPTYKQALKRRWDNIEAARAFAIKHFMNVEPAFRVGFKARA